MNFYINNWKRKIKSLYRRVRYHWFTPYKLVEVKTVKMTQHTDLVEFLPDTIFQLFVNFLEREYGESVHKKHPDMSIEEATIKSLNDQIEIYKKELDNEFESLKKSAEHWIETLKEFADIYRWIKWGQIDPDKFYPEPTMSVLVDENKSLSNVPADWREYFDKVDELENTLQEKKTNMAVRIVQLRQSLWT
jgi:hypothetical protein